MEKQIHYYSISLIQSKQLNMFGKITTLAEKIQAFKNNKNVDENAFKTNDKQNIIEILELDEKYLFGSIGKLTHLNEKTLTRARKLPDYELEDSANISDIIEQYTYFLLDYNELKCNILFSNRVGKFGNIFSEFLFHHFRLSGSYDAIEVLPVKSKHISERLNRAENITSVSFNYVSKDDSDDKFVLPWEMNNLSKSVRRAKINLDMKTEIPKKQMEELKSELSNKTYDNFDSFYITTNNEIIDMVEKIIIEKKLIDIKETELKDIEYIKSTLIKNFNLD